MRSIPTPTPAVELSKNRIKRHADMSIGQQSRAKGLDAVEIADVLGMFREVVPQPILPAASRPGQLGRVLPADDADGLCPRCSSNSGYSRSPL